MSHCGYDSSAYKALKQSMDELLRALDGYFKSNSNTIEALDIINTAWLKAEALKEKEE